MSTLQNVTIHILDFFTFVMWVTQVGIDTMKRNGSHFTNSSHYVFMHH